MNRNVAPTIDAVAVQDPAVIFISSAYPSAPQVVEATNPDEYGIFTSLDSPRDRAAADQGQAHVPQRISHGELARERRQRRLACRAKMSMGSSSSCAPSMRITTWPRRR